MALSETYFLKLDQHQLSRAFQSCHSFVICRYSVTLGGSNENFPPNDSNNPGTWPRLQTPEVGPDPDYRSRLRLDSAFFFRTRIRTWSQKFV